MRATFLGLYSASVKVIASGKGFQGSSIGCLKMLRKSFEPPQQEFFVASCSIPFREMSEYSRMRRSVLKQQAAFDEAERETEHEDSGYVHPGETEEIFPMDDLNAQEDDEMEEEMEEKEEETKQGNGTTTEDSMETGLSFRRERNLSGSSHGKAHRDGDADFLFKLILRKDVSRVKQLLSTSSKRIDLNSRNAEGETFLLAALATKDREMAEVLLSAGADVNAKGRRGLTPIHLASMNGDFTLVSSLLAAGSDPSQTMDDGSTVLHCACQTGNATQMVELFLKDGAHCGVDSTHTKDRISGYTALHLAVEAGDLSTVRLLLENGARVNAELEKTSTTPLHMSSRHGYTDVTGLLLERGAEVNATADDAKGSHVTPLHVAVENNHLVVAKQLIDAGAPLNEPRTYSNKCGVTALHLAAMKRNADMVKLLLERGIRLNEQDGDGATALHLSARGGYVAVVGLLLKQGAALNLGMSSKQSMEQTPLHLAVRFRHYEVVKMLITAGSDVNLAEKMADTGNKVNGNQREGMEDDKTTPLVDAYTPLHWAVENNDLEMVCLLLDNDAQPNRTASFDDHTGLTPLHLACQDGYHMVAQELLRHPNCQRNPLKKTLNREDITPLHQATYNGHVDTVRVLLENGCDVNIQADNGYSALHYAAQQGNLEMAKMIVKHGGNVRLLASAKDQLNITALHLAVQSGNVRVVRTLVEAGARIEAEKTMGGIREVTALHQAVYQEKLDIVETLLDLGACVNGSMNGWYTALHVAAEKGCMDIAALLLQRSADVHATASYLEHVRLTPLHVAAQHGRTDVVRLLVESGADLEATRDFADRSDITALHLAVENGFEDTVKVLLELGSQKDAQDSLKFTPLHVAVQYNFPNIVRIMLDSDCDTKRKTISGLTAAKMADQNGSAAIRQMFKEHRRKSKALSFRKNAANKEPIKTKNKKSSSSVLRLLCGLKKD